MNKQCVIWVAADAPGPMLMMQSPVPLLLHYISHQAQVTSSVTTVCV